MDSPDKEAPQALLKKCAVAPDNEDNRNYYRKNLLAQDILIAHQVHPEGAGRDMVQALDTIAGGQAKVSQ